MSTKSAISDPLARRKHNGSAEQLLNATAALLSERGSLDVTLNDIANRSGLNGAMIKYYFGNKDGLLLALLERDADLSMVSLQHLVEMPASAEQKLRIHISGMINTYFRCPYLNRLIHMMAENPDEQLSRRVTEIYVNPMSSAYRSILQQGVQEGVFWDADPTLFYHSLVGACDHFFRANYFTYQLGGQKITDDMKQKYTTHVTNIFLRGLIKGSSD